MRLHPEDATPTCHLVPVATSTPTTSPYIPTVVGGTGELATTPVRDYIPSRKSPPLDRSLQTQAILAEIDAQSAIPSDPTLPTTTVDEDLPSEDLDFIDIFPDLSFEETPLIPPLPPTPRCAKPSIRSTTPTGRPKVEQIPTPETIYQRKKHFRSLTVRPKNQRTTENKLSHPPTFIPIRGKPAPPLPGYQIQDLIPQRKHTIPARIPTNPRTLETRIVGLQRPPTIRPLMDINARRLKKIVQRVKNMR